VFQARPGGFESDTSDLAVLLQLIEVPWMSDSTLDVLAAEIGARFLMHGLVLASAESCTGGWVAQAVTSVSGSSEWFDRGFVTYSNAAKQEMLGVRGETLERFGAVSEETAREMASGALAHSRAGVALSITGIAGPTGGTPEKPVGMVCFAWARQGSATQSKTLYLAGDRQQVRRQAVAVALEGILKIVDKKSPDTLARS
jgi:nicotinamide-nucleotide amidase